MVGNRPELIKSVTSVATSQRPFGVHSLGSLAQSDARLIPAPLNSAATKTHHMISNLVKIVRVVFFHVRA